MKKTLVLAGIGISLFFAFLAGVPSLSAKTADFIFENTGSARIALLFDKNDARLWFEAGNYYFEGRGYNLQKALVHYNQALAITPSLLAVHYQLARIDFLRGNFGRALTEIDKEIKLAPDFEKAYYVKGLIQGYAGQFEKASENFKKFISFDPLNWAGYNDLAWIYFKQGAYAKAKEVALEGLKQDPENPWLNNSFGVALLNLGDKIGAATQFEKALRAAELLTTSDWGKAYPGNDPAMYEHGFAEMKESIASNLELAKGN